MYDLLVIGWGKGGKTLAGICAKKGLKVAIIEKDPKMYGGTCPNVGCLPTKSVTHRSNLLAEMTELGLERTKEFDRKIFKNVMDNKFRMVEKVNKANFNLLNTIPELDVYNGEAKFISNKEVMVNGKVLTAKNIIINTGSKSIMPPIKGIELEKVNDSTEILNLTELPDKILIVGGGYIGLEFAGYFADFNSEVVVLEAGDKFLPLEDDDVSEEIHGILTRRGVRIEIGAKATEFIETEDKKILAKFEKDGKIVEEVFDRVLVAVGRKPNTEGLGLENTDIQLGTRKEVVVDKYLRTNVPNVYAVGDVKGGPMFTYVSLDDSRIILPQLFGEEPKRSLEDGRIIPKVLFISPKFASVGMTEKEAKAKGVSYTVKKVLTKTFLKAIVINETEGFSKVLVDENDEIIGASLINYEAGELINLVALAMHQKIKSSVLKDFIFTHPVYAEGFNDIFK